MKAKPYSLRWLFECPFLFSLVFFFLELNGLPMYMVRTESENYWLKMKFFPIYARFNFLLFAIGCLYEFTKFSINLYRRHKKNLYKISDMYSDGRHLAILGFLFIVLVLELAIGCFIDYSWRLGLHAIILFFLISYTIDLSRKKQLLLVKAIKRMKPKEKYRIDNLTIGFYAVKNMIIAGGLLVVYDGFPISIIFLSPAESARTILSMIAFIYSALLLMMGPLFLIANIEAKKLLRSLGLEY